MEEVAREGVERATGAWRAQRWRGWPCRGDGHDAAREGVERRDERAGRAAEIWRMRLGRGSNAVMAGGGRAAGMVGRAAETWTTWLGKGSSAPGELFYGGGAWVPPHGSDVSIGAGCFSRLRGVRRSCLPFPHHRRDTATACWSRSSRGRGQCGYRRGEPLAPTTRPSGSGSPFSPERRPHPCTNLIRPAPPPHPPPFRPPS